MFDRQNFTETYFMKIFRYLSLTHSLSLSLWLSFNVSALHACGKTFFLLLLLCGKLFVFYFFVRGLGRERYFDLFFTQSLWGAEKGLPRKKQKVKTRLTDKDAQIEISSRDMRL